MVFALSTEAICEACIWNHDPEGLARTAPCDPTSWAGSVQQELLAFTTSPDLFGDLATFPAYFGCAAVLMVKDEADIIRANLDWLYHIGVRRFVVMDNASTDGTYGELLRFRTERPEAQLWPVHDPVLAYYQAEKTTRLAQLALSMWPDIEWVLPMDADEFCIARVGLQTLGAVPPYVDALTVPKVVHFIPEGDVPPAGNLLAQMSVRSAFFAVPPKVLVRARSGLGIAQGNHRATAADGRKLVYRGGFQFGFYIREFQTRSFAQFLRKVRNGGAAVLAANAEGSKVGGEHWIKWHNVLTAEGEAGLREIFRKEAFRLPAAPYSIDRFTGAPS